MVASSDPADLLITHALGSCLGIAAHDPEAGVGGLLHVMMPLSSINPEKAQACPYMFVDTGVPSFFREMYKAGGVKNRLVVKVAGGANVHRASQDRFEVGKRNYVMLKKMFWKNGVLIDGEDTGGECARTMYLEIGSGRVWLTTGGVEKAL
jgi:chemotaxis protein CheD